MKTLLRILILSIYLTACNSGGKNSGSTDSVGITNPSAIDTTIHPNGVTNSDVISTDTAAMNTQNAYKKADSAKRK